MKPIIYLANPYGFSVQQKELLVPIKTYLSTYGLEVWEPFERNQNSTVPHDIGEADLMDVKRADAIFAIVNGTPPDEGVMVELGYAMALGKDIYLFRDDFRRCADSTEYPLNLMVFAGLPAVGWQKYLYTSVEEILSADKALAAKYGPADVGRIP